MRHRFYLFSLLACLADSANISVAGESAVPANAPNCNVSQPPEEAGAYVTPGGFLLVYPRNHQLTDDYTGCKSIWIVDSSERMPLLMTAYFEQGALRELRAFDGRGGNEPRAVCELPSDSEACKEAAGNPLVSLKLATWPRICVTRPETPACTEAPQ